MSPDPKHEDRSGNDQEDATNRGVSAEEPAEGADDDPAEQPGSPRG